MTSKKELIEIFRANSLEAIKDSKKNDKKHLVKISNNAHNSKMKEIFERFIDNVDVTPFDFLLLRYCYLVSMLEMRHQIWPYDYMAFSRRMGEVWESFCSTCWEVPGSISTAIAPPKSEVVQLQFISQIGQLGLDIEQKREVSNLIKQVFSLSGRINLKLDMFCESGEQVIGIDFKSGFGSNEKGNTDRLLTVGKTYKYLFPEISLYILVRQEENNNYLKQLMDSGIWHVHCGKDAYKAMVKITGIDIIQFVEDQVDFSGDMSSETFKSLKELIPNCDKYLKWI